MGGDQVKDCGATLCEVCNRSDTGWVRVNGLCPACAHGVNVLTADEMLEEREAQLARAMEMKDGKIRDEYVHQIKTDIERIKRTKDTRK